MKRRGLILFAAACMGLLVMATPGCGQNNKATLNIFGSETVEPNGQAGNCGPIYSVWESFTESNCGDPCAFLDVARVTINGNIIGNSAFDFVGFDVSVPPDENQDGISEFYTDSTRIDPYNSSGSIRWFSDPTNRVYLNNKLTVAIRTQPAPGVNDGSFTATATFDFLYADGTTGSITTSPLTRSFSGCAR